MVRYEIRNQTELNKAINNAQPEDEIIILEDSGVWLELKLCSSRVVARGSSRVEARGSSRVEARDSSRVESRDLIEFKAPGGSVVTAMGPMEEV